MTLKLIPVDPVLLVRLELTGPVLNSEFFSWHGCHPLEVRLDDAWFEHIDYTRIDGLWHIRLIPTWQTHT